MTLLVCLSLSPRHFQSRLIPMAADPGGGRASTGSPAWRTIIPPRQKLLSEGKMARFRGPAPVAPHAGFHVRCRDRERVPDADWEVRARPPNVGAVKLGSIALVDIERRDSVRLRFSEPLSILPRFDPRARRLAWIRLEAFGASDLGSNPSVPVLGSASVLRDSNERHAQPRAEEQVSDPDEGRPRRCIRE